jgi:hypothetical protein
VNTTAQVGGALGLAVLASVTSGRTSHLLAHGHSQAAALTGGYHLGFWISAALVLVGVLVAATVLQSPAVEMADAAMHESADSDLLDGDGLVADATC